MTDSNCFVKGSESGIFTPFTLATAVGLRGATLLSFLAYRQNLVGLTNGKYGRWSPASGQPEVYFTHSYLLAEMPFIGSLSTLRRTLRELKELGLLDATGAIDENGAQTGNWFHVNADRIMSYIDDHVEPEYRERHNRRAEDASDTARPPSDAPVQNERGGVFKMNGGGVQNEQPNYKENLLNEPINNNDHDQQDRPADTNPPSGEKMAQPKRTGPRKLKSVLSVTVSVDDTGAAAPVDGADPDIVMWFAQTVYSLRVDEQSGIPDRIARSIESAARDLQALDPPTSPAELQQVYDDYQGWADRPFPSRNSGGLIRLITAYRDRKVNPDNTDSELSIDELVDKYRG